ncbi:tyrosine-protein kinase receptor UFO-like [Callorhinchus milii]|uniref:tyrosine-protein kinase receptor UFO-like n=1 Tax=Callorhinchus milii TaxID=7868 RepID=UPI001C3FD391|nr:tyrosine-protein kinase receptor UFO-like [Callorhinchus milii]
MWEIASRGQTPYPGVENSEIYDYLRQGKRLKQPPDCPDPVYELMSYCWRLEPQERPSFAVIGWQLGKLEADLVAAEEEDMLYVNMEEAGRGAGATGGLSPALGPPQPPRGGCSELTKANLLIAADVHPRPPGQRYVLCPPHDRPGPGAPLEPPEEQCGCESD